MKNNSIISNLFFWERNQDLDSGYRQEWIDMETQHILKKKSNLSKHLRINISFIEDHILDIEFFDENDDIDIKIYNQFANEMYGLLTFTMPTLHIIVEMKEWPPEIYQLLIRNEDHIFFYGNFALSKSVAII